VYPNSSIRLSLRDKDVTGAVNTVIQDSGNFFNEPIGTIGGGQIDAGSYSVVYDECQDGYFDDNVDFLFYSAFEVGSEVFSVPPAEVNDLKARAGGQAHTYAQVAALVIALHLVSNVNDVLGASTDPADFLIWLAYTFGPSLANLRDPFEEVNILLLNNIKHSLAIAADPPDAGFMQFTPLSGRQIIDLQSSDPLLIAVGNLGAASSNQAALAEALLRSLERYQGAEAAGDGDWALTQARAIKQYAGLLAAQLSQGHAALGQLSNALANDTRPLDVIAADLESQRALVESSGFSPEERQALASLGLTVVQIDALRAELASQSFVFTKANLLNAITNAQNSHVTYSTALNNLAAAMDANITALGQDPLVTNQAPQAHAGGPYHVAEGANIVFAGGASTSPSNIISYEWDLDGDGSFNDATSPNPGFTYTRAFQGLVGLKVTNADNLEGDAVSVRWLVDGTSTATGLSFTYTPSTASGGLHIIEAVATDASPLGGSERLSWIVALPAPADSANLSIAMNGTSESGQGSDTLTYEITVTNNGPAPATGVMLTDNLPAGLSFGSMTASQGSCTPVDPDTVTCALGNLANGASATATLLSAPTTSSTITNTARVTAAEFDPDLVNNSTSQGIGVDFIWFRRSEISGYDDIASVAVDATGVYVTTLDEESGGSGIPPTAFLIKYDTSGTEIWRHEFTGRVGNGVRADTSGLYTIGITSVSGIFDTIISKFDAHGGELWTRQFGGSSHNFPADIALTAGGVYIVGSNLFGNNPFVRTYDTNGTELWTVSLSGCCAGSIAADASGVYVLHLISG
jgi:uncharacterized repeat protein (TIGR01451 family)